MGWYTQSIHQAVEAHRTIRQQRSMRSRFAAIYGETRRISALMLRSRDAFRGDLRLYKRQIRKRILVAQGNRCYLCPSHFGADNPATLDHVKPLARAAGNAGNLLLACELCNRRKGSREPYPCEPLYLEAVNVRLGVRI